MSPGDHSSPGLYVKVTPTTQTPCAGIKLAHARILRLNLPSRRSRGSPAARTSPVNLCKNHGPGRGVTDLFTDSTSPGEGQGQAARPARRDRLFCEQPPGWRLRWEAARPKGRTGPAAG
jgi:hypothetical protein